MLQNVDKKLLPKTECLKDTVERVLPYWHDNIVPSIKAGQRVLLAAHGNTIRAIVKYFDGVSDKEIVELNIPTGTITLFYALKLLTFLFILKAFLLCTSWTRSCAP